MTERALGRVDKVFGDLPRSRVVALALLGVGIVGTVGPAINAEISLSFLYLCPVALATWYAGAQAGIVTALLSTIAVVAGEVGHGDYVNQPGIALWNAIVHLGFTLTVAYLLERVQFHLASAQRQAKSDPLTGVLNARAFAERLQQSLDLAARDGRPVTLAYIDLDDFKQINDRHGHGEGDRLLQRIAGMLSRGLRRTDAVARLGGDEFAVLLGGADRAAAEFVIGRFKHALSVALAREQVAVSCSIGSVTLCAPLPNAEQALRIADSVMYEVKKRGKNAVDFRVLDGPPGPGH
ncbi:MAG: GGDEF domain-containing protein [Gemmatimonadota bacterium]